MSKHSDKTIIASITLGLILLGGFFFVGGFFTGISITRQNQYHYASSIDNDNLKRMEQRRIAGIKTSIRNDVNSSLIGSKVNTIERKINNAVPELNEIDMNNKGSNHDAALTPEGREIHRKFSKHEGIGEYSSENLQFFKPQLDGAASIDSLAESSREYRPTERPNYKNDIQPEERVKKENKEYAVYLGQFLIQDAEKISKMIKNIGLKVYGQVKHMNGKTVTFLIAGPFKTIHHAKDARQQIEATGIKDTKIVSLN